MSKKPDFTAFTTYSKSGLLRELTNQVRISKEIKPASTPVTKEFTAIWDTGATNCCITQKVVDELGLKPIGMIEQSTVGGKKYRNTYLASIYLPNNVTFSPITVVFGELTGGDILIGMDIISHGDFAVTNKNGATMFSFRYPSIEHIDYVKEFNKTKPKKAKQKRSNRPKRKRRNPPKKKKNKK